MTHTSALHASMEQQIEDLLETTDPTRAGLVLFSEPALQQPTPSPPPLPCPSRRPWAWHHPRYALIQAKKSP